LYGACSTVFAENKRGNQYLFFGLLLYAEKGKIFQAEQDRSFVCYWPGAPFASVARHGN
jgi:hypothetical protein